MLYVDKQMIWAVNKWMSQILSSALAKHSVTLDVTKRTFPRLISLAAKIAALLGNLLIVKPSRELVKNVINKVSKFRSQASTELSLESGEGIFVDYYH